MPEVLPDESDQNFLYQLICSQLENDGYIKSAKCLQVELNTLEASAPGDKLEKLVNMCIQIKKHIDGHFNNYLNKKAEAGKLCTDMSMDADSTNTSPDTESLGALSPAGSQPTALPNSPKHFDCPMEDTLAPEREEKVTIIETSDATSSSEVTPKSPDKPGASPVAKSPEPGALDSNALKQQLFHQHLILQQIQLQQLQNSSFDEQAKRLSEYMLNCYKSDLSMIRDNTGPLMPGASPHDLIRSSLGQSSGIASSLASSVTTSKVGDRMINSVAGLTADIRSSHSQRSPAISPNFHSKLLASRSPGLLGGQSSTSSPHISPTLSESTDNKTWINKKPGTLDLMADKLTTTTQKPPLTQAELDRKRFPCRYCGRRFTQQSALQVHERTHTGEKPYHCHYCDKAFTQISNLKCHERLHTGEKPYRCQLCGKRFTQSASLRCHMRSHTGERPYLCKFCNKRFTQPASLQHHIRIHTGEKPYKCDHCGKCFTQPSSLVVHRRLHTGERPFVCQICGKSYTQAMPLKEHMRTHHSVEKSSPLSFNIGQPFSLQMNRLQTSLSANIGNLPFLLSSNFIPDLSKTNTFMPDLRKTTVGSTLTQDTATFATSPSNTMSQILFNRQNTAFQSVFPSVSKEAINKDSTHSNQDAPNTL